MRKSIAVSVLVGLLLFALARPGRAQDMLSVGELLNHCRSNSTLCAQDFGTSSISMAYLWAGNCIPTKLSRQQKTMAVLRWLAARPELAQEDAPDGVADAVTTMWPCANQ
jgi:hypothetical protein